MYRDHQGNLESEGMYRNDLPIGEWKYYENGKLSYIEKRNKKSNVPELIQENDYKGNTISLIEISDNKKQLFIKTVYYPNGKLAEQGNLVYSKDLHEARSHFS